MRPKISVIVPIYNTEQYLPGCIDSILAQSFTDFELILVNDGSLDNSAAVCSAYEKRDPRIKVITKSNGGVSSARNAGLEIAAGEYLLFVDADDFLEPGYFEKACSLISGTDADLYIGGFCEVHEADHRQIRRSIKYKRMYSLEDLLNRYEKDYPAYWLSLTWGKLFKTDIILDNGLRFDTRFSYKEDALFVYSYLRFVNQVYFDDQIVYHYRIFRSGSSNVKIYTNMYQINCQVYEQKRNLMIEKQCPSTVYNHVYFGSLMNSIEYFYAINHPDSICCRQKTITAVCENELLARISINDISGLKRKLMFVLCKLKAKRIIAILYQLRFGIRG